jgi:hypothetical protein
MEQIMKHRADPETVSEIINELDNIGQFLRKLADALIQNPADIIFTDAPSPYGNFPSAQKSNRVFNWWEIPDREWGEAGRS